MNVLELFSGTGSVGKCCKELGWDVVSVDMEKKFNPTHLCNIMEFDYKQYPKNHFDIVWGSPPCTNYSQLKKCWFGRMLKDGTIYSKELNNKDMDESDKIVLKTFEIIDYFNCEYWFVENPLSSLKDREIMKDKFYHIVDYCMYSDWGYKKRTCIWTNKIDWEAKQCDGKGTCGNMIINQAKHKSSADGGYDKRKKKQEGQIHSGKTREERYRVPPDLIYSLFLD
tara:strand:+ start:2516 stop:3190 length:675 start_codon:yes stop_codon:yes gene_type:complete